MKLRETIAFVLLLLVALVPNLMILCLADDLATPLERFAYFCETCVLYAIGLCLLHKRAYLYTISLGFALSAFELMHLLLRHSTVTVLYLYTWFKTPPAERWAPWTQYWWVAMVVVGLWLLYYVMAHYCVSRTYIAPLKWRLAALPVLLSAYILLPARACPMNMLYQLGRLSSMAVQVERHMPEQRAFTYGIQPNASKAQETVIVVLAEAGYEDFQRLCYSDSLAVFFDSVYAPCAASGVSLPLYLSRATPQNRAPFFSEKSVIQAFNEAGFYTAWLSNYGYHDHFLMRIADDCHYLAYMPFRPDTALLPSYREVLRYPSQRHMVVMATQGTRDTASFVHTPELLWHLTDSLRTTHQPAMLVYAGAGNISRHTDMPRLHVPFVIWANPNYRYRHRALMRRLKAQSHMPVSTESIFHTLLYMNNIETGFLEPGKAIGHLNYEAADTIYYFDENLRIRATLPALAD